VTVPQLLKSLQNTLFFFLLRERKQTHNLHGGGKGKKRGLLGGMRDLFNLLKILRGKEALSEAVFYPYAVKRIQLKISSNFVHTFT